VRAISSSPNEWDRLSDTGPHALTVSRLPRWLPRFGWPWPPGVIDTVWTIFALANLDFIFMFPGWETIPFHMIWASMTLVYGFRVWKVGPTLWIMATVMVLTAAGIAVDVWVGSEPVAELTEDPLLALMFLAMAWHARRKLVAERSHRLVSEQYARLLRDQRRFLQDAAHQLRTPITIALGHAELLASAVDGQQETEDIQVVIGELSRLRSISDRLLIIAAAGDPAFLHPEPVALDLLVAELVRRWRPTAERSWRIGQLNQVTVRADRERLGMALDALLENAVRHTGDGDAIQLSVIRDYPGMPARIVVADAGDGIPADRLPDIFDRFRTGEDGQSRGTGLGLPLVRAVARAHGGNVTVHSVPGEGSEFELTLPVPARPALTAAPAERMSADRPWTGRAAAEWTAAPLAEDQGSSRR
jgi:signal transduction histidine kinase